MLLLLYAIEEQYSVVDLLRGNRPINLFHQYSFYCANELLRRNLLPKHSTPCCCGLCCMLSKMAASK